MTDLRQILKPRLYKSAWWMPQLTKGYFGALSQAVKDGFTAWSEVEALLRLWVKGLLIEKNQGAISNSLTLPRIETALKQCGQAIKLLVCAKFISDPEGQKYLQANAQQVAQSTELQGALTSFSDEFMKGFATQVNAEVAQWLQATVCLQPNEAAVWGRLLAGQVTTAKKVTVPFATFVKQGGRELYGKLYRLTLELVQNGFGHIGYDPRAALNCKGKEDFAGAITLAWQAQFPNPSYDQIGAIWCIEEFPPQSVSSEKDLEIEGPSAGAAAAVGFYHALRNQFPDNRVIYFGALPTKQETAATITERPFFTKVGGVKLKTQAVLKHNDIDTIVVFDADNFQEAKEALCDHFGVKQEAEAKLSQMNGPRIFYYQPDGRRAEFANLDATDTSPQVAA